MVLRETEYRRLFWGRTISFVGDGIAPVAIAFAVLDLTGSVTDLGLVMAARSLSITALVLVGGVFADRISPRLTMLRADLLRMAAVGAMGALLIGGVAEVWQLVLLYGVEGAGTAFFNPASDAIVPAVVGAKRLQEGNALLNLSGSAGRVAGPALAGILLALGTPGWALAVDAVTFGGSAFFLWRLRAPAPAATNEPSFASELRHGWREFSSRRWLVAIVLSAAVGNAIFFPAFQILGPAVASDSLGGSGAWALIAACFGVGALAGGALALATRPRRPLLVSELAVALFALPIALLAGPAPVLAIALGALLAGAGISLAEILYETTVARNIPRPALSRVYAYDWFGSLALEPVGMALIGPVAAGVGVSPTLWAAAVVLVLCQAAALAVPEVRRIEADPAAPPPSPLRAPIEPGD
jgi:MFS family permease